MYYAIHLGSFAFGVFVIWCVGIVSDNSFSKIKCLMDVHVIRPTAVRSCFEL